MLKLDMLIVTPISENTYIFHNDKDAIIFDAGGEFDVIDKYLSDNKLTVKYLLNTHGHFDHIGAVYDLQQKYKAPFYIHKLDENLVSLGKEIADSYGMAFTATPKIDKYLNDKDVIEFSGCKIEVIHTPGHTMGGVCFLIRDEKILISGDTLFYESIGRTDFPQSNHEAMLESIQDRLYKLDDDISVFPGHGRRSTIGHEKANNPFVRSHFV